MSIDVVIANYNQGHLISNAINCLNKQKFLATKIFIIDDSSTDNSVNILQNLRSKFKNIYLILNERNLGPTICYSIGLKQVKSEFVYFAAADDETYPNLFELSIAYLQLFPNAPFSCAEVLVNEGIDKKQSYRPVARPQQISGYLTPKKVNKKFKYTDNWILTGTCIYRTNMLQSYETAKPLLEGFSDSVLAKKIALTEGCVFLKYVGVKWNVSNHGVSRGMFKNFQKFSSIKMVLKNEISTSKEFPTFYWKKFSSRLDFTYYRFVIEKSSLDQTNLISNKHFRLLNNLMNKFNYSRKLYKNILILGIFIKFRPYSLRYLINTGIHRKLEQFNKNQKESNLFHKVVESS